jgi:DNA-binding NtrC family response regulator
MKEYSGNVITPVLTNHRAQPMLLHPSAECSARKILLVENEEGQRLLYEQELNEEGYLILSARNGKEALKRLPEMDGIEVLSKIVSRYKKMPIVLHTAYAHYKNDFMTWLADAFVVKSSDLSVLKKTVKELLRKSGEEKDGRGVSTQEIREFYETNP